MATIDCPPEMQSQWHEILRGILKEKVAELVSILYFNYSYASKIIASQNLKMDELMSHLESLVDPHSIIVYVFLEAYTKQYGYVSDILISPL